MQIDYIINNQEEELDITIPTHVSLSFRNTILNSITKRLSQFSSEFVKVFNTIHKRSEYSSIPKWKKILITSLTLNHIDEWIFHSSPMEYGYIEMLTESLLPSNLEMLSDTSGAIGFYDIYKNIIENFRSKYQGLIKTTKFDLISEFDINVQYEVSSNLIRFLSILYTLPNDNASNKGGEFNLSLPITLKSADLLNAYIKSFRRKSIIDLDWLDMSSGEKARLAFLARLFSIRNKSQSEFSLKGIKSLIFLIDEGEQYFHPDWQKRYIQFLIVHLGKMFPQQSIQVVLTSHSPFVLSDLTRSNVVYLMKIAKDKKHPKALSTVIVDSSTKEQTFASNIHLLFTDAYFMQDGLIGEFAKNKINDMLEPLISNKVAQSKIQGIKDFIAIIGEPIIQGKLNEMLNDYIESKEK